MVEDMLCTGQTDDLPELIKQCGFSPQDAYLLVERLPQQVVPDEKRQDLLYFSHLRNLEQKDIVTYTSYTSGRVFDRERELHWEHDTKSGKTHVVYLGQPCVLAELPEKPEDKKELASLEPAANKKYYYLFGQLLAERDLEQMGVAAVPGTTYYAEVRIPRLLLYPKLSTKPPQRLKLAVYEYVDQETGRVKLFRFQGLQPAE